MLIDHKFTCKYSSYLNSEFSILEKFYTSFVVSLKLYTIMEKR